MQHLFAKTCFITLLTCIIVCISTTLSFGYLRIHPENPHYFEETATGIPVMITGFGSIVPTDSSYDYREGIEELRDHGVMYARVWHFLPWAGKSAIWPWNRSNVPGAPMGGFKIDMNNWNPDYWNRMRDALSLANKAGIYAEIHLFDRCGMSPAGRSRWMGNPWASDNNINNIETPPAESDGTPEFYQYAKRPNLRKQQERYVRKMIDETIEYPNVIYEIENEHWEDNSPSFGRHYASFIKKYTKVKYPKLPRLVSYNSLMGDLETFYDYKDVDIVNKHFGGEAERDPDILNRYLESHWYKNKAMNIDEFANGLKDYNILRQMCWIIVTSGGNFHIEDASQEAKPYDVLMNIRHFLKESSWDFIHSSPDKKVVASGNGYCMKQEGKEYIVYFPNGSDKSVLSIPQGEYSMRWWNTTSGGFSSPQSIVIHNDNLKIQTPDSNDWVLQITSHKSSDELNHHFRIRDFDTILAAKHDLLHQISL